METQGNTQEIVIFFSFHAFAFALAFSFHTCEPGKRKCKHKVKKQNKKQTASFSSAILERGLELRLRVLLPLRLRWTCELRLSLHLRRTCEPGFTGVTILNPMGNNISCKTCDWLKRFGFAGK